MSTVQDSAVQTDDRMFERVYPVLRSGLRKFLYRRGLTRAREFRMGAAEYAEVLDEVTDEALCVAWQRLPEYRPDLSPLGWWIAMLARKVFTRALNRWRRNSRHARNVEEMGNLPDPAALPEFRTVEDRDQLASALAALPKDQARALALSYLYDLSAEEVGRLMGRGPDAVSSLLQRARANAKDALLGRPVRHPGRPRKGGES